MINPKELEGRQYTGSNPKYYGFRILHVRLDISSKVAEITLTNGWSCSFTQEVLRFMPLNVIIETIVDRYKTYEGSWPGIVHLSPGQELYVNLPNPLEPERLKISNPKISEPKLDGGSKMNETKTLFNIIVVDLKGEILMDKKIAAVDTEEASFNAGVDLLIREKELTPKKVTVLITRLGTVKYEPEDGLLMEIETPRIELSHLPQF